MSRQVSRAEKALYMRVLETGTTGIDDELLYSEMEEEYGYPREVVKVALDRLAKAKHIAAASPLGPRVESALPSSIFPLRSRSRRSQGRGR